MQSKKVLFFFLVFYLFLDATILLATRLKYHLFSGPFLNIIAGTETKPLEIKVRNTSQGPEYIWIIPKSGAFTTAYSHVVIDRSDLPIATQMYQVFILIYFKSLFLFFLIFFFYCVIYF
jgi:hypothetical protein